MKGDTKTMNKRNTSKEKAKENKKYPYKKLNRRKENGVHKKTD